MLFSYLIAYIALFYSLTLSGNIRDFDQDVDRYACKSTYDFELIRKTTNIDVEEVLLSQSCLTQIEDFPIFISLPNENMSTYSTLLMKGEDLSFLPILEGNIRELLSEPGSVAIGKWFSETYHLQIGNTVKVGNDLYKVVAVIGTSNSDYMSDALWFSYDEVLGGIRNTFRNMDRFHVRYSDNAGKAYNLYLETYNKFNGTNWDITPIGGVKQKASDYMDMRELIYFGIYAFALLQCVIASELWIYVRRYEMAVRRTLGFSRRHLILVMFRQLLFISLFAIFICFGVQYVVVLINGSALGIRIRLSIINLCLLFGFGILTAMTSLWLPVRSLGKETAAVSIQKGSDGV